MIKQPIVVNQFGNALIFLCVLSLSCCGVYENKYSKGIIDPLTQTVFNYPGQVSLTWLQTPSSANGITVHTMTVFNRSGENIDSLHALALGFSGSSRAFENLVLVSKIKFKNTIPLYPQSSNSKVFQETLPPLIKRQEVFLLKAFPLYAISNQGFYSGIYTLYKNRVEVNTKRAIGLVDYEGVAKFILEGDSVLSRIDGTLSTTGNYSYTVARSNNKVVQIGSAKINFKNSNLQFKIPLANQSFADTLLINLNKVP
jgi:hypothetical protein